MTTKKVVTLKNLKAVTPADKLLKQRLDRAESTEAYSQTYNKATDGLNMKWIDDQFEAKGSW